MSTPKKTPAAFDHVILGVWDEMVSRHRTKSDYSDLLKQFAGYACDAWGLIVCGPDGVAIGA